MYTNKVCYCENVVKLLTWKGFHLDGNINTTCGYATGDAAEPTFINPTPICRRLFELFNCYKNSWLVLFFTEIALSE